MAEARILDYFCRVEGEELVCVVRLWLGGRYLQKEFREEIKGIVGEDGWREGALGC
jgi:hypothetical protein